MSDNLNSTGMPLKFGQYKLIRRLRKDPIGELYSALLDINETQIERRRFVRIVDHTIATESGMRLMLEAEASLPMGPYLLKTLQHGFEGGIPYVAYEYLDGVSTSELIRHTTREKIRIPFDIAAHIAGCLLQAVRQVHGLTDEDGAPIPLVHGNIRPETLLVGKHGEIRLGFFNASFYEAAIDRQKLIHYPDFYAPDAEEHELSDTDADLWGAAAVFWTLLTGKATLPSSLEIENQSFGAGEPIRNTLKRFFSAAFDRRKERRFQDARAMLEVITPLFEADPALARKTAIFINDHAASLMEQAQLLMERMAQQPALRRIGGGRVESEMLTVGEFIDNRYKILDSLGKGGMGEVFRVKDLNGNIERAVKVLEKSDEPNAVSRFLAEAKTTAGLAHLNIVKVLDSGVHGGADRYIVMELLSGTTLKEFIEAVPTPEKDLDYIEKVVQIILSVCDGLKAAHEEGIVHRDIKPSNIFLHRESPQSAMVPKILDFGIAKQLEAETTKLTRSGAYLGTAAYSAPEQIKGKPIDQRADIYSIGMTLYHALTGTTPFRAERTEFVMMRALSEDFKIDPPMRLNPQVPKGLSNACMLAIRRDEKKRFQAIDDFAEALRSYQTQSFAGFDFKSPPVAVVAGFGLVVLGLFGTAIYLHLTPSLPTTDPPADAAPIPRTEKPKEPISKEIEVAENPVRPNGGNTPRPDYAETDLPPPLGVALPPSPAAEKTARLSKDELEKFPAEDTGQVSNALISKGRQAMDEQRYVEAKAFFSKALSLSPDAPEALFGFGETAFQLSEHQTAVTYMQNALTRRERPQWRIVLGQVYMTAGDREAAVQQWRTVEATATAPKMQGIARKLLAQYGEKVE